MQLYIRILLASLAIRLLLLLLGVGQFLAWRIEVSTPADSILSIREGVTLNRLGVSPYAGSAVRLPPFLLWLLSTCVGDSQSILHGAPNMVWDVMAGLMLWGMARRLLRSASDGKPQQTDPLYVTILSPDCILAIYLLNPFLVASSITGGILPLHNMCIVGTLAAAVAKQRLLATAALAISILIVPHSALLMVPLVVLFSNGPEDLVHAEQGASLADSSPAVHISSQRRSLSWQLVPTLRQAAALLLMLVFWMLALVAVSDLMLMPHPEHMCIPQLRAWVGGSVASSNNSSTRCWLHSVYSLHLLVENISPNVGQWWYFFSEVFKGYRTFFCFIMLALPMILSVPTALRFPRRPIALFIMQLATNGMLKPYPSVADFGLVVSLLPLLHLQLRRMRTGMFLISTFMMLTVLGPAMLHQWIDIESANSNFYYSITLLLGAWNVMFLLQLVACTADVNRLFLKGRQEASKATLPCVDDEGADQKQAALKKDE